MSSSRAVLMQGNEACAEAALAAGLKFFAGYPITPSSEIAEILAERLPQEGGKFIQMEDEIASMAAVIGASLAGLKAMTATSGPGFSLKQENIGYAAMAEVPCVIVDSQRVGPSTGMPTSPAQGDVMQARWGTHGDHPIVVLSPASVRETYELTIEAFNIAEALRIPVILLLDEVVSHMRERIEIPAPGSYQIINRKKPEVPPRDYLPYQATEEDDVPAMAAFGDGYRFHVTGLVHDATGFPTEDRREARFLLHRLVNKVQRRRDQLAYFQTETVEDAEVVVVAFGSVGRSALRAVRQARAAGMKVGLFRPKTIWPFPEKAFRAAIARARAVLVAEMNLGQLILEVERLVAGRATVHGLHRLDGDLITPQEILKRIEEV